MARASTRQGLHTIAGGTCTGGGVTNASGQRTIIVNSNAAGQSTVNAAAAVSVSGVVINVATNGIGESKAAKRVVVRMPALWIGSSAPQNRVYRIRQAVTQGCQGHEKPLESLLSDSKGA